MEQGPRPKRICNAPTNPTFRGKSKQYPEVNGRGFLCPNCPKPTVFKDKRKTWDHIKYAHRDHRLSYLLSNVKALKLSFSIGSNRQSEEQSKYLLWLQHLFDTPSKSKGGTSGWTRKT